MSAPAQIRASGDEAALAGKGAAAGGDARNGGAGAAVDERFLSLVSEWRSSIRPSSTLLQLVQHPAYGRIVGMGLAAKEPVTRLILRDLEANPYHWFQALEEITGENPVPEDATTFEQFRQAWLAWGRTRGLL